VNDWSAQVRFGAHYGLKSDIARGPKSANVTLATLQCAARIVGRSLRLELV
jgi:hypothetical protein